MEYLVTMTTHVPQGTAEDTVMDVRAREAEHSRELAVQGHLLRLWRPPLQPGEWRTLGLFAADDPARLEDVLASMPLRVWRTDSVTSLAPHPNDPGPGPGPAPRRAPDTGPGQQGQEFLVTFTITVPDGVPAAAIADRKAREARRARELAQQRHILRVWLLPDGRTLGLYRARDAAGLEAFVASLPLIDWMTVETVPLTPHPNDPAGASTEDNAGRQSG
jgi:muconolactone delta-isomerase